MWAGVSELRSSLAEELAARRTVVSLQAFADLAGRAREAAAAAQAPAPGTPPEEGSVIEETPVEAARSVVGKAVELWTEADPRVRALRVVDIDSRTLVASTDAADRERGAPPRRLVRDEKPVYDLARQLRSAVEANREGGVRQEEIVVEQLPDGGLRLSTPWVTGGEVAGLVQVDTRPMAPAPRPASWRALAAAALPVVAFLALWPLLRGRRWLAGVAATLLVVAGVGGYALSTARSLAASRRGAASEVAVDVAARAQRAEAVLAQLGAATHEPLQPAAWDADRFRHPRGELTTTGLVKAAVDAAAAAVRKRALRPAAGAVILALALFLIVGTGAALQAWTTLVRFRVAYAYALPAMIGMLVLVFFPFLYGITLAFTNANIYNSQKPLTELWVGLSNFTDILGDFHLVTHTAAGLTWNYGNFYWTLLFTIVWTVTNVALGVTGGLVLALILNTPRLALRPVYRVILSCPGRCRTTSPR